eukprot:2642529-Ditylum_brightwellii.AAC.1
MIRNGMWDVFLYLDPKSKRSIDLLKNFGIFHMADVQEDVVIQCQLADKYASDNLDWSEKYLLNSTSNSLYQGVLKK